MQDQVLYILNLLHKNFFKTLFYLPSYYERKHNKTRGRARTF